MGFRNPILAGPVLVRAAMQSANFSTGVAGWQITRAGHAEFNDIVIRNSTIQQGLILVYTGTPANGNLLVSISGTSGSDSFGNNYPAGIKDFGLMSVESADAHGGLIITMDVPTTLNPGTITIFETAAGNGSLAIAVSGDTSARYSLRANGDQQWGPGNAAADTFFRRLASGLLATAKNLLVGSLTSLGDNGVGELALANAATVPTTNPTGGGVLYAAQAVPTWRDTGGQLLGMVRTYHQDSTGALASFTAEADVPGATLSVVVTGANATVIVTGYFDFQVAAAALFVGFLTWNGSDRPQQAIFQGPATSRGCVSRTWRITGVTAGTYTAKLRASCTVNNAGNAVENPHTGLTVTVVEA